MEDWLTGSPKEIVFFYASVIAAAVYFLFRKRPRPGMLLRLRERTNRWRNVGEAGESAALRDAKRPLAEAIRTLKDAKRAHADGPRPLGPAQNTPERFSRIQPGHERPLNVMFNYNGHSWDAYEVLGLPAGSSPEKADDAFSAALKTADPKSRAFLTAAHHAIQTQWNVYKKVGQG